MRPGQLSSFSRSPLSSHKLINRENNVWALLYQKQNPAKEAATNMTKQPAHPVTRKQWQGCYQDAHLLSATSTTIGILVGSGKWECYSLKRQGCQGGLAPWCLCSSTACGSCVTAASPTRRALFAAPPQPCTQAHTSRPERWALLHTELTAEELPLRSPFLLFLSTHPSRQVTRLLWKRVGGAKRCNVFSKVSGNKT